MGNLSFSRPLHVLRISSEEEERHHSPEWLPQAGALEGTPDNAPDESDDSAKLSLPFPSPQQPYFYFVHRDIILSYQSTSLPCMQQLRDSQQLVKLSIDIASAFCGDGPITKVLFVSHRWETPEAPDLQGVQLKEVQQHLKENQDLKFVWFDFWCMPQGNRTSAEEEMFRDTLKAIADLYLTAKVLILLDNSYSSRFWTLFEAWLS